MSDDTTSDALSRASAFLDGELAAPEMAAVEADPAVMAEVARLGALQDSIRDVSGPTSPARDMAIAAALAEYDRLQAPATPAERRKPQPNYGRWLSVAAAVAALAVLGAVITTAGRGGDGDDDSAQLASAEQSVVAENDNAADRVAPGGGAPPASAQPEAAPTQAALSADAAIEAPAAATEAGGLSSQEAAATTAASATTAAASAPDAFDPATPIPDEAELGRIGRRLLAEWRQGARQSMPGTPCAGANPDFVFLSDAVLIVDGASRPVLLAGNPATDETLALDPDSCVLVMRGI